MQPLTKINRIWGICHFGRFYNPKFESEYNKVLKEVALSQISSIYEIKDVYGIEHHIFILIVEQEIVTDLDVECGYCDHQLLYGIYRLNV